MAQLVIAAAGAALGGYLVPGVIAVGITGAQAGWIVGSLVGSAFAPAQKVQGPRLSDLSVGSSAYGTPIPFVQGSPRLAGQVVYASTKREIATTTRQGGKGGGSKQKVTTYTYEVDLLILLTDNVIPGITRIWSNGKLIWNKSLTADAATIAASDATPAWTRLAIYTGTASQLPDPTYEAAVGTANAPAYRGRGSVFIQGLQLGSAGQIPNLTFEIGSTMPVLAAGTPVNVFTSAAYTDVVALSSTKAIVGFRETVTPDMESVVLTNPSGTTITVGSPKVAQTSNSIDPSLNTISATKMLYVWGQQSGALAGYAAIQNISGTTITTVTPVNFAATALDPQAVLMSSTQAVVVYNSGGIKALVLDISVGDVITMNAVFSSGLPTSGITSMAAAKLDATSVLVTWVNAGNNLMGVVLLMSGGTLTAPGGVITIGAGFLGMGTQTKPLVALSSSTALVMCQQVPATLGMRCAVLSVSGTAITLGADLAVTNYTSAYASAAVINSSTALLTWIRQSDGFVMGAIATPGGIGTPIVIAAAASSSYPTVAILSPSVAICTYNSGAAVKAVVVTMT